MRIVLLPAFMITDVVGHVTDTHCCSAEWSLGERLQRLAIVGTAAVIAGFGTLAVVG
jgi:hypothetical protein